MRKKYECILNEMSLNEGLIAKIFILLFRLAQLYKNTFILGSALFFLYRTFTIFLRIDFPTSVKVGVGLRIYHPFCIAIHPDVVIGNDCILRHGVTLGVKSINSSAAPVVYDGVEFGCYAVVIGDIEIPSGSKVKALSLTVGK